MWKLLIVCACVVLCLWVVCGCAPIEGTSIANPRASVQIDPLKGIVRMESSRDDKAEMAGFSAAIPASAPGPLAGTTVKCDSLKLDASASKVRREAAGQTYAFADYKLAEGEAAANVIDAVGDAGSDILAGVSRLRKSEKANQGYQIIFALFAFALALFALLIFAGLLVYLLKKAYSTLFPPKPSGGSDLLLSLITGLAGAKK